MTWTRKQMGPRWLGVWCLLGACLLGVEVYGAEPSSVHFYKPFFGYLRIKGTGVRRISLERLRQIEESVRKVVERARYHFVKIPEHSCSPNAYKRRMIAIVAARSKGLAKMRAEWNSQFQGYPVTAELLRSIQNNSYYYWIEVTNVYAKRSSGLIHYVIEVKIHIHQLVIFDCRAAHRRLSRQHRLACQGRRLDSFSGFSKLYKVLHVDSADSLGSENRDEAFSLAVRNLKYKILKQIDNVRALQLHAPVSRGGFASIYFPLGKAEGLRLNQSFDIYVRHVRGHLIYKGYARVRRVGDNRMKMVNGQRMRVNPNAPYDSIAQPLIGAARKGMLLYEQPRSGFFLSVFAGMIPLSNPGFGQAKTLLGPSLPLLKGGVLIPTLRLGGGLDISASIGLNELYLDLFMEVGFGGFNDRDNAILPLLLHIGLAKRFYLNRVALSLGVRLAGGYVFNDPQSSALLGADAFLGLELLTTSRLSLALRGGFRAMFPIGSETAAVGPWAVLGGYFDY